MTPGHLMRGGMRWSRCHLSAGARRGKSWGSRRGRREAWSAGSKREKRDRERTRFSMCFGGGGRGQRRRRPARPRVSRRVRAGALLGACLLGDVGGRASGGLNEAQGKGGHSVAGGMAGGWDKAIWIKCFGIGGLGVACNVDARARSDGKVDAIRMGRRCGPLIRCVQATYRWSMDG